ncbi:MAG: ABC transporter substrate-binding protein [Rhodothermales bacterium]|nr:ABC transporter substrate-binding protein [Rhodothermales bacterium]MBO6779039.1 ABC transporter substrate-binding protein [Rhodothermales bacterium]
MRRAVILTLLLALAGSASAQLGRVPANPEADSLFARALQAFEAEEYADAAAEFSRVAAAFPLHANTTAAAFMHARALYRVGAWERAGGAFESFIREYPTSRYVTEAERMRGLAMSAQLAMARRPVTLGIVLSLDPQESSASQSLFNGIRLAIDAHNGRPDNRQVEMVFRDLHTMNADAAVADLVNAGAALIVGALFSDQAQAVGAAAERYMVPFVAPLATDPEVSQGLAWAFQANPTITARGRLMARFAVNGLRLRELGVIAEDDELGISEEMGRAFAEEAEAMGASVRFIEVLPNSQAWFRLGNHVEADSLRNVRAVYAPLSGAGADRLAGGFLAELDDMLGTGTPGDISGLRVLGNAAWHDLPFLEQASRYVVTYSNDFHFEPEGDQAQAFTRRHRTLTGQAPDRLAVVGYDLSRLLVDRMMAGDAEQVRAALLSGGDYQGLGIRVHFAGDQVNRTMFYHRYRNGVLELMR